MNEFLKQHGRKIDAEYIDDFFTKALHLIYTQDDILTVYDLAKAMGSYLTVFYHLYTKSDDFPVIKKYRKEITESLGYKIASNGLRNKINTGMGIFILKNTLGWKDRADITSGNSAIEPVTFVLPMPAELIDG